jgi:hypothetical protein
MHRYVLSWLNTGPLEKETPRLTGASAESSDDGRYMSNIADTYVWLLQAAAEGGQAGLKHYITGHEPGRPEPLGKPYSGRQKASSRKGIESITSSNKWDGNKWTTAITIEITPTVINLGVYAE